MSRGTNGIRSMMVSSDDEDFVDSDDGCVADLDFSEIPHTARNDDLVLGAPVPLPAENVGRVALSPAEVWLGAGDVNTDENITGESGTSCRMKRIVVIRMWGPWRILNGTLGRTRLL